MAKQKAPEMPPKGSPLWMASWSDMMSLLMCFFLMLFALSSVDEAKFKIFADSVTSTFSIFDAGGTTADSGGMMIGNGASQLHELGELYNSTGLNPDGSLMPAGLESGEDDTQEEGPQETRLEDAAEALYQAGLKESQEMAANIGEAARENNLNGIVDIQFNSQYVKLTMSGSLLFDSGKVDIKEDAEQVLLRLIPVIKRYATGDVQIEGHTDNVPMGGGGRYSNNDELSSGRAYSVYKFFMDNSELDPTKVIHAGRGEYHPIAGNDTAEGRQMNRRVEIKLYNSLNSMM